MEKIRERHALKLVVEQLEKLIGEPAQKGEHEPNRAFSNQVYYPDLSIVIGGFRFVVEYKASSQLAQIVRGIEQLQRYPAKDHEIRLLATPFMGRSGIEKCAEMGISWLDLSGNADISAPGLRLYVRGQKNKFISPGRKENPFAPKSSRVARHMLYQPSRRWTQRELAEETGLGEGFVSRIVKTLVAQQLINRDNEGRLFLANPWVMLEAWQQGYDFNKHEIFQGHVAGRSGEETQAKLSSTFKKMNIEHAATGLGAAWLYSRFASFRTVSIYLKEWPDNSIFEKVGFREKTSGANVWLIIPRDSDVFYQVSSMNEIPCVHPVQVWLDLSYHPERAQEAADILKNSLEL
jgi:hypothetical protein